MTVDVIAQIFGICGMTMNILSFQMKEQRNIIFMQLIGSVLFSVNYFLLGVMVGAMLNLIGIVRALAYWKREFFRTDSIIWVFALSVGYIIIYILSFAVFGTEAVPKNFAIELLPVIGMVITTVSFYIGKGRLVRFLGLFNAPLWLTYNIINFTIGGIICESIALCSIIIGIFRYDVKKAKENK